MLKPALSIAAFVLCLQACQTSDPVPLADYPEPVPYVSRVEGDSLSKASDSFGIDSAWMEGDSLFLAIVHGGGCAEHDYALYASDYTLESLPPQVDIWFHHNGHGDLCKALLYRRVGFDMWNLRNRVQAYMTLRIHQHPSAEDSLLEVPYLWPYVSG